MELGIAVVEDAGFHLGFAGFTSMPKEVFWRFAPISSAIARFASF